MVHCGSSNMTRVFDGSDESVGSALLTVSHLLPCGREVGGCEWAEAPDWLAAGRCG